MNARAVLAPLSQSLLPAVRLIGCERGHVLSRATGIVFVDPGFEIVWAQVGKRQHEIGEVALRVNDDDRNGVDGSLLDDRNTKPGLAASRHADAQGVRHEILGVVEHELLGRLLGVRVEPAPQVEDAELLEVVGRWRHKWRFYRNGVGTLRQVVCPCAASLRGPFDAYIFQMRPIL